MRNRSQVMLEVTLLNPLPCVLRLWRRASAPMKGSMRLKIAPTNHCNCKGRWSPNQWSKHN